ncbi:hypothetical protein SAMN05444339_11017 [Loktanella atrilutea]|uniref:Uncharacterized protein n=1 Tax=Loktanella atrilutea TaxID=366533 RepID=A0A1M5DJW9_LOKAT|nr:hypothetical protein [Loktanella atrilutea]SHF67052.1 hypothetical protein SAMN05444339_11017 [Loktanella atrilutea]
MSAEDRLLAAFLGLAIVDRPELAALQSNTPVTVPLAARTPPPPEPEPQDEQPRPDVRAMLADLQAAMPELPVGAPGWEATRPAWPDSWFNNHDPGDVVACRRLWASALLACIRDRIHEMTVHEERRFGAARVGAGWIGSRDFHEMCALADVDGVAVAERLARIDEDPALRDRILKEGAHKSHSAAGSVHD